MTDLIDLLRYDGSSFKPEPYERNLWQQLSDAQLMNLLRKKRPGMFPLAFSTRAHLIRLLEA